jgi:hypothetical protein
MDKGHESNSVVRRRGTTGQTSVPVLLDALHLVHERYGVAGPAFYLLRPDTYVAGRGPLSAAKELKSYLEAVFSE